ncbi:hypothetical protein BH20ACT11_BH20ACT11_09640 [soil metagenome]
MADTGHTEHRLILVREADEQMSGSGCCGRLGGVDNELGDAETYAHTRREMESMGEVYRALKSELADFDEYVKFEVVDPRNMVWLIPAIMRDGRRHGRQVGETLSHARRGIAYNSVILDGKVLFHGHIPSPEEAIQAVRGELGLPQKSPA